MAVKIYRKLRLLPVDLKPVLQVNLKLMSRSFQSFILPVLQRLRDSGKFKARRTLARPVKPTSTKAGRMTGCLSPSRPGWTLTLATGRTIFIKLLFDLAFSAGQFMPSFRRRPLVVK